MSALKYLAILISIVVILILPSSSGNMNFGVSDNLKGKFLVEQKDGSTTQAWYSDPSTGKLHFLGQPQDAYIMMQKIGLGISNEILEKLKGEGAHLSNFDTELAEQLAGRILIQTDSNNQVWYIWPEDNERYFIGRSEDAGRIFRELGEEISFDNLKSYNYSNEYQESQEIVKLASLAMESEISNKSNKEVDNGYKSQLIRRFEQGDVVVLGFTLDSPIFTEEFGYLGLGEYRWPVGGDLLSRKQYLKSSEYRIFESKIDAEAILNEIFALQTSLDFYFTDVNGYPLSQKDGDRIGIKGRRILTDGHGFYGSLRDKKVYYEMQAPEDIVDFIYYSNGKTYAITFKLEADTEFYKAGEYTLTPDGIVSGIQLFQKQEKVVCDQEFLPVCGVDGKTYTNRCFAEEIEKVFVDYEGACRNG